MSGPGDETASAASRSRGNLRASRADRERVVELLKAAFVEDRLTKEELDTRVGQALAARTYGDLAAVTADFPAEPAAAQPPRTARAQGEQPVQRPGRVILAATALCGGVWAFTFLPPWPTNSEGELQTPIIMLFFFTTLIYLGVLVIAVGSMVAGWREKRSGGRRTTPAGRSYHAEPTRYPV